MRALLTAAITTVLLVLVAAAAAYLLWTRTPTGPVDAPSTRIVIGPGESLSRVARALHAAGAVSYPRLLSLHGRLTGMDARIRAGEYDVPAGLTPGEILEYLATGPTVQYSFTVVEGWTYRQMLEALRRHEAVDVRTRGMTDVEVLAAIDARYEHPEGLFLPETYRFPRGETDLAVLGRAHDAMMRALDEAWSQREGPLPYSEPYEVLIMASIVEKETAVPAERSRIAGVFVRRLQRGMRLQTDPTVIYGIGEAFDGDIRRRDLRTDTPYNTYTRHGLPPTPIALPGRDALMASVAPADGDALYFVSRGDGTHVFSETLEQHEAAVRRYQLGGGP